MCLKLCFLKMNAANIMIGNMHTKMTVNLYFQTAEVMEPGLHRHSICDNLRVFLRASLASVKKCGIYGGIFKEKGKEETLPLYI